jgi:hypothetical protein
MPVSAPLAGAAASREPRTRRSSRTRRHQANEDEPMLLIQVLIVGCLHSNPNFCEDFRIPVAPQEDFRYGITPTLCTKFTFDLVHNWEKQHDTYFVKKWTCTNYVKPKITL